MYEFKTPPMAHQRLALKRCRQHNKTFFAFLLQMGLGKSFVLLADLGEMFERGVINGAVIVAPKGCYQVWRDEQIPEHLPERFKRRVVQWQASPGKKLTAEIEELMTPQPGVLDIFVVNVEALAGKSEKRKYVHTKAGLYVEQFLQSHPSLMTIDESTCIQGYDAARTKGVVKLGRLAKHRRILTGDAMPDSPLSAWSQAEFLEPGLLGHSFVAFRSEYCCMRKMNLGTRSVDVLCDHERANGVSAIHNGVCGVCHNVIDGNTARGYKNLDRLREKIAQWRFIAKKDDCLNLPPKVYLTRHFDMSKEQRAAYESMRDMAIVDLENKLGLMAKTPGFESRTLDEADLGSALDDSDLISGGNLEDDLVIDKAKICTASLVLVQMLRLQQITCGFIRTDAGTDEGFPGVNPRIKALLDWIEETSGSVLIWANHRYSIFEVTAALKAKYGEKSTRSYFGDTTNDERAAFKADFQAGAFRFGVLNQQTGGMGLTLTKAGTSFYYSNHVRNLYRAQSEDRNHRIGATGVCVTYGDLICPGTTDETIYYNLRDKKSLSAMISPSNWKQFLK